MQRVRYARVFSRWALGMRAIFFIHSGRDRIAHPYQPQKRVRVEPTYVYSHKRRRLPFIAHARAGCSVYVRNLAKSRQVFAENRALP